MKENNEKDLTTSSKEKVVQGKAATEEISLINYANKVKFENKAYFYGTTN